MYKLCELFREKLRVKVENTEDIEIQKKAATRLALDLKTLINIGVPLLKPYNNNPKQVQMDEISRDIIEMFLNSDNAFIVNNQEFIGIRDFLQSILDNNLIIELNNEFYKNVRRIARLSNSLQNDKCFKPQYTEAEYLK